MRRITYIFLLLLASYFNGFGQQRPQYTQYIFNNYLLNPAISGIENYLDFKAGFRKQWTGIENAPKTSFVSAHWNLSDEYLWKNPLSMPEDESDPRNKNYMQNYTSSPAHSGMGVMAVLDKAGPISRLDASLTYAYHLQLSQRYNLSVGVGAGITRIGLDLSALSLEKPNDPALNNTITSQVKPDLSVGVWFYGAQLFIGASVQQLIPQKLAFTSDANYSTGKEVPHIFLTAGYKFFIDDDIAAIPSFMIKQVSPVPMSIDANLKISFKEKLWVGASYRKGDSYAGMVGFNFKKLVNLTYSYDLTTSELSKVSNGTHEIVLGLQLNNVYNVLSTMRMW